MNQSTVLAPTPPKAPLPTQTGSQLPPPKPPLPTARDGEEGYSDEEWEHLLQTLRTRYVGNRE